VGATLIDPADPDLLAWLVGLNSRSQRGRRSDADTIDGRDDCVLSDVASAAGEPEATPITSAPALVLSPRAPAGDHRRLGQGWTRRYVARASMGIATTIAGDDGNELAISIR